MIPAATVTVRRNRPTRTADYGPAPEGHPKAKRRIGKGRKARPARLSRILRSGSTFQVDAQELQALQAWLEANPGAARDVQVRELPQAAQEAPQAVPEPAPAPTPAPKASRASTRRSKASTAASSSEPTPSEG